MIRLAGRARHVGPTSPYRGIVTRRTDLPIPARHRYVLLGDPAVPPSQLSGFQAVIGDLEEPTGLALECPYVVRESWMDYLADGDIVSGSGATQWLRVLYRANANSNSFLLTERCSSNCVMCSQPPTDRDDSYLANEALATIPLMPRTTREIGLTGGEPLLLGERFIKILESIRANLPETSVHVLTNGRLLAYLRYCEQIAKVRLTDLMLGIPIYSDIAQYHDFVVQARGAFDQTIRGILNAKRYGIGIEIRVVLHAQTVERLPQLARFIARNLPFVDHVAFMGLEHIGYVKMNSEALKVDPADYQGELTLAIDECERARLRTSIYNLSLCVLPPSIRRFAMQSISDWKNAFDPECARCAMRSQCAGFFSWNLGEKSRLFGPLDESGAPTGS